MAKKKKVSLDQDSIKQFFIQHGEKIGLGVAILLVGFFFWLGSGVNALESDIDPKQLADAAKKKKADINNASWDEYVDYRTVNENPDTTDRRLTDEFVAGKFGEAPLPRKEPRLDPELRAPQDMQVSGRYIAFAISSSNPNNLIDKLPKIGQETKNKRGSGSSGRGGGSSFDDEGPSSGSGGGSPGGAPGGTPGGAGDGAGPGGAGGGAGGGMFGGGSGNNLPGEAQIPQVMYDELQGVEGIPNFTGAEATLLNAYALSVTAVIPYELQWKEYENKLKNAIGYNPRRDIPEYAYLEVQRRTVTDGTASDWKDISSTISNYQNSYIIDVPEVAKSKYIDPALTLPIPPIVDGDIQSFAIHPSVQPIALDDEIEEAAADDSSTGFNEDDFFSGNSGDSNSSNNSASNSSNQGRPSGNRGGRRGGQRGGQRGGSGGSPYGDGGYPDGSNNNNFNPYGDGGNPYGGGGGGYPSGGNDNQNPYGGGGNPYGGGGGSAGRRAGPAPEKADSDYKLIRFFDLSTKPGESYEYRVRVWLKDVNVPEESASRQSSGGSSGDSNDGLGGAGGGAPGAPAGGGSGAGAGAGAAASGPLTTSMLDPSVRTRLRDWKDSDFYKRLKKDDPRRDARATDWTEPTTAVTVPKSFDSKYFAGPVPEQKMYNAENIDFPIGEPGGSIAFKSWDNELRLPVPGERKVMRGDLLNFKRPETGIMNPFDLSIRLAGADPDVDVDEDELDPEEVFYSFKTDAIILDIVGGERLQSDDRKLEFFAPGEMLLIDENGDFIVVNEYETMTGYRHATFAGQEKKPEKKKKEDDKQNGPGGYPGFGGSDGYPNGNNNNNFNPYGDGGNPYGGSGSGGSGGRRN